jgi:hypothetical protein
MERVLQAYERGFVVAILRPQQAREYVGASYEDVQALGKRRGRVEQDGWNATYKPHKMNFPKNTISFEQTIPTPSIDTQNMFE